MSDEESFVILGTSPVASLVSDGINGASGDRVVSLQKDTPPGSCFSSLKNSQINELENARKSSNKSLTLKSLTDSNDEKLSLIKPTSSSASANVEKSAERLLWSRPQTEANTQKEVTEEVITQIEVKDDFVPLNLEDCSMSTSLAQTHKTSLTSRSTQSSLTLNGNNKENQQPSAENGSEQQNKMVNSQNSKSSSSSKQSSLASSFIMGEVNADVLKSSVYSQFPSISMQACAEDVVKLQNMVTEYMQLKTTLEKINTTMKMFYENSLQWKEKMNHMETNYKQQLDECQKQIVDLRTENDRLKKSIEEQVEQTKAVDVARQNDRDDMIRTISEKTALIENMRAQIVKLEEQQISNFEFLPKKPKDKGETNFDSLYITRGEHDREVKDLKRQLSELLASNLDHKFLEKQYIDELNCLKHNLAQADETITTMRSEIAAHQLKIHELQKSNTELLIASTKQNERISLLELENQNLVAQNAEQNERILLLEHQNEVHKKDFEMERESRQTAVGEKQQILQDLRALQRRNQELIEEHQRHVENYERRISNSSVGNSSTSSLLAAAAAAQTYINNPQRPIRDLPSAQPYVANNSSNQYNCPLCNKSFKSISVLTSHVNDCIDKN